jgi:hypothetical protein
MGLLAILQIEFYVRGRPSGDTAAKEVLVFCRYGAIEEQGSCCNRPVVNIARAHSLAGR